MEKEYCISGEETAPNSYTLIVRRAVILCILAVPVGGFNIFAPSQHGEAILYWSLAITVTFVLISSAFVLWAGTILWPPSSDRAGAVAR